MAQKSKLIKNSVLWFGIANLAVFIIYFLFTQFEGIADTDIGYYIYVYVISYLMTGVDVLFPLCAAGLLFSVTVLSGGRAPIYAIGIALTRFFYLFPYYYLYFVYDGFDSIESCVHSALWSVVGCIIHYAVIIVSYYLIKLIAKWRCTDSAGEQIRDGSSIFDFSSELNFTFFLASLVGFVYLFVKETVFTVSFLIDVDFSISPSELISILISYITIIIFLFVFYVTLSVLARRAGKALFEKL